jgi:hypothetical protein
VCDVGRNQLLSEITSRAFLGMPTCIRRRECGALACPSAPECIADAKVFNEKLRVGGGTAVSSLNRGSESFIEHPYSLFLVLLTRFTFSRIIYI